jgi:uncharacterized protein (DUF4415 family)
MKKPSETDLARIDAMRDEDIDTSDIPVIDEDFFSRATIRLPERKTSVTLRLDKDVVDWYKKQGKGYQTRMNAVLKAYMKAAARK